MRRVTALVISLAFIISTMTVAVSAESLTDSDVLITQVQAGSKTSASQEFIEIFNATLGPIDLSDVRIEYFSASSTFASATRTIKLAGMLEAGQAYTVASNDYMNDQALVHFSATLAATGGHVRVVKGSGASFVEYDRVGWGSAVNPELKSAPALSSGDILSRKVATDSTYIDTNNNFDDFEVLGDSQSSASGSGTESSSTDGSHTSTENPAETFTIEISELLPNPAAPQQDSADEFVELFNPNGRTVNLRGYSLQSGTTYNHSFTFSNDSIGAGEYKAFYISQTKLTLANSGGRVRILAPDKTMLDETAMYDAADDGEAWAWLDGQWQWTRAVTPNAQNILEQPVAVEKASKKSTTKKATAPKPKSSKSTKSAKSSANGRTKAATTDIPGLASSGLNEANTPSKIHPGVLVGVGVLAVLYGAYEYKQDVKNFFVQRRRNRGSGS